MNHNRHNELASIGLFRELPAWEQEEFRQWARDHHDANVPVSDLWHPVIREEWERLTKVAEATLPKCPHCAGLNWRYLVEEETEYNFDEDGCYSTTVNTNEERLVCIECGTAPEYYAPEWHDEHIDKFRDAKAEV